MNLNFEPAIFRKPCDPLRFIYPADRPLAADFEEQMVALVLENKDDGECLSAHHPEHVNGALGDTPDATVLALWLRKAAGWIPCVLI